MGGRQNCQPFFLALRGSEICIPFLILGLAKMTIFDLTWEDVGIVLGR